MSPYTSVNNWFRCYDFSKNSYQALGLYNYVTHEAPGIYYSIKKEARK
jgi:hypothetical protein